MSNGNGHRWSKFWWQDWQNDEALRMCSLAAQGLWMRVLCVMHGASPIGHLLVNGKQPTMRQLASICGALEKEVAKLMTELGDAGVYSVTQEGTIYSRRMVSDAKAAEAGREWGKKGGNPTLNGKDQSPKNPAGGITPPLTPGLIASLNGGPNLQKQKQNQKLEAEEEKEEKEVRPFATLTPSAGAEDAWGFEAFWSAYPRKVGRGTAAKAFAAACRKAPAEVIIAAVQQAVWSPNPKFIPHPTTWLHGERWTDEVEHPDAALLRAVGLSPGGLLQ